MTDNFERKKENLAGSQEPMNPDEIQQTAVNRGEDTEITEEGNTRTNSPEAQEKYRRKGMTEV